jgi:hypothetical protein
MAYVSDALLNVISVLQILHERADSLATLDHIVIVSRKSKAAGSPITSVLSIRITQQGRDVKVPAFDDTRQMSVDDFEQIFPVNQFPSHVGLRCVLRVINAPMRQTSVLPSAHEHPDLLSRLAGENSNERAFVSCAAVVLFNSRSFEISSGGQQEVDVRIDARGPSMNFIARHARLNRKFHLNIDALNAVIVA